MVETPHAVKYFLKGCLNRRKDKCKEPETVDFVRKEVDLKE